MPPERFYFYFSKAFCVCVCVCVCVCACVRVRVCSVIVSKKVTIIGLLSEPCFAPVAFYQLIKLHWFNILYGSQNTTFYFFYDKMFLRHNVPFTKT
jgi:hypothetical protein